MHFKVTLITDENIQLVIVGMPKNAPGAPLEMCVMHLLYYADPSINTKSYYIRGQCTEKQLASFPKNSREQLPSNSLLDEHAKKGNQKGVIRINENISMNMVNYLIYLNIIINSRISYHLPSIAIIKSKDLT